MSCKPTFIVALPLCLQMAPLFSQPAILLLIESFKDEPCLWDFNNPNYNKKNKRSNALQRIITKLAEMGEKLTSNCFIDSFSMQ